MSAALEAGNGTDTGRMNSIYSSSSSGQDDSQARETIQIPLTLTHAKITLFFQFPKWEQMIQKASSSFGKNTEKSLT